jgi:hypothetical protein
MKCRFCNLEKPLGDSHIIPKSFFPPKTGGDTRPNRLLSNKEGTYPKKMPIGVYDQTILCHECEKVFDPLDDYSQKLLLENESDHQPLLFRGETIGFYLPKYDYDKLKKFFISLLWRASVSTHDFYRRINLGPHEPIAMKLITSSTDIPPELFSVVLSKFDNPLGKAMLDPYPKRMDNVNYNVFYLGGYNVWIKTDKRNTPTPFSELMLSPGRPLQIIARDISTSKELPLLREIAIAAHNRA